MIRELWQDTETYSEIPIAAGVHKYAEAVEVMIFAYAWDDEPVKVIDLTAGEEIPEDVIAAQNDPTVIKIMHNSAFDRTVMRAALGVNTPAAQVHDTMVQALAHGLPGALGTLCEIHRLPADEAKDKRGRELINLFCKPRPKNQKLRRATRETHSVEWSEFKSYAGSDITSMRSLRRKLPTWNYNLIDPRWPRNDHSGYTPGEREHLLWQLDQKINDRGFKVDVDLATAAISAISSAQEKLADRTQELTDGNVERATQRDKMLKHILEYHGVELPDLRKDTLERRINDPDLPRAVRELLAVRLEASMASTGKYKKLLQCVSADGRLRGTLQFDGASRTRRWAGRMFQPQNLPRPTHKQSEIDSGIAAIKAGCIDVVENNVMAITSSCVRGVIVPSDKDKKLVVSDLSNIEGRAAAWLAGEEWKLQAFRDYDTILGHDENGKPIRKGHDLYNLAYAKAFNIAAEDVTKDQRQIGKVNELMLQYEGGVGAWLTGAMTYRIDLDELAVIAWPLIPEDIRREAEGYYDWCVSNRRSTLGLDKLVFTTCDALKRLWRRANPAISSYWPEIQGAFVKALHNPGQLIPCRKLNMIYKGAWLRIILPSGYSLCYASPRLDGKQITFMGQSPYSRQWKRQKTYGGKLFENVCQSLSRDVMGDNMMAVENEGYEILLTVHDELPTETLDHNGWNAAHLSKLLATQPVWAEGFPLAAGGFEAPRYRKD